MIVLSVGTIFPLSGRANESIPILFHNTLIENPEVVAAQKRLDAAKERLNVAKDGYYPELSLNASYGILEHVERKNKGQTKATISDLNPQDLAVSITQNIFRGGTDSANIRLNKAYISSTEAELEAIKQSVLMEMISSYVNVHRYNDLLKLAKLSVTNIEKQTELENTRIERGKGYNTDLLQAKSQLAESKSRLVRAERGLMKSINTYERLFQKIPDIIASPYIDVPRNAIPQSLDIATERAVANSLELKIAKHNVSVANERIGFVGGSRFGQLDAILSARSRNNLDGAEAEIFDYSAKIAYSISTPIPSFNNHSVNVEEHLLKAAQNSEISAMRDVALNVKVSWNDFKTAEKVAELENNRASIAQEFLNLARRERELNRRSLLEVLSGETNLYAAKIQAISAQADEVISSYSLLKSLGLLRPGVVIQKSNPK